MAQLTLKGNPIHTTGPLPSLHTKAPSFVLVDKDLKNRLSEEFLGRRRIITTVPSLDTGVCSTMTQHFNELAKKHPSIVILTVSADLPFAQKRFCESAQVANVHTLSMMRDKEFGRAYGVLLKDGPLAGILARSVFVIDENDEIIYIELVPEITQEPKYKQAIEAALGGFA